MKSNIIIRPFTNVDRDTIYQLIQTAFESAEHRDGTEQDFAENLRQRETYIPQLDLLAELNGALIGHIMFTETVIHQADGQTYPTLMVAPLSVLLEYRSAGVGSALMKAGIEIAHNKGYRSAFLIGDPHYYQRYGFTASELYGIHLQDIPAEYVLALELTPGSLNGITGTVELA